MPNIRRRFIALNRALRPGPPRVRALIRALGTALILTAAIHALMGADESAATMRWTMLNVCGPVGQADCHLLTLPDGRHVLIDSAEASDAPGAASNHLRRLGVSEIAMIVISHFHQDHYGRLLGLLGDGIKVDRVVVSIPGDRRIADREMP
jgi:glyoxylase-like metal-dependent hydrolase (beta-lactamase superfamily II)